MRRCKNESILGYPLHIEEIGTLESFKDAIINTQKTLYDVYNKPSKQKIDIYNYLVRNITKLYGKNAHIITSYNNNFFTIAFYLYDCDRILKFTPTKCILYKQYE